MNTTIKVKTSIGEFEIIKPKAGVRNRAMMAAETDNGNLKQSVLMFELLPKCINKRPEGCDNDVPIEQILDSLEIEDYDELFVALSDLIDVVPNKEDQETKN